MINNRGSRGAPSHPGTRKPFLSSPLSQKQQE